MALDQSSHVHGPRQKRLIREALERAGQVQRMGRNDADVVELLGNVRFRRAMLEPRADSAEALLQAARRDLEAVVREDPRRAGAWSLLSQVLRVVGEHEKAYFAANRAFEEDAYLLAAGNVRRDLFRSALKFGRFDLAGEQCVSGGREFPDDWRFRECRLILMAWNDSARADPAAAAAALLDTRTAYSRHSATSDGNDYQPVYWQMLYAQVLARAGQRDSARAIMTRARTATGNSQDMQSSFAYEEAYLLLLLGDRAGAAAALGRVDAGNPLMRRSTANDYLFRSLRSEPLLRPAVIPG